MREYTDYIYFFGSYTAHLVGLRLKKTTELPWIADFRDPWVENTQHQFPTALHRWLAQNLERQVIRTADRLVVVSQPMLSSWLERYPWLDPGKVAVITNGYDAEDFIGLLPVEYPTGSMTIIYNGSFYSSGSHTTAIPAGSPQQYRPGPHPRGRR